MPFPLIPIAIGAAGAWLGKKVYDSITEEDTPATVILRPENILLRNPSLKPVLEIDYRKLLDVSIENDTEDKSFNVINSDSIGSAIEAMANLTPKDYLTLTMRGGLCICLSDVSFFKAGLNNPNTKAELNNSTFPVNPAAMLLCFCEDEDLNNLNLEDEGLNVFKLLQLSVDDLFNISVPYLKRFVTHADSIERNELVLTGHLENVYMAIDTSPIYGHLKNINIALQKLVLNRNPKLQSRLSDFLSDNHDIIDFSQYLWSLCDKDKLDVSLQNECESIILNTQALFSFSINHGIEAYHCATMIVPEVSHEASLTRLKGCGFIDKDTELGRPENEKLRQIIVCTDQPRTSLNEKLSGILCAYAEDLVEYNDSVSSDLQLKFEIGHPQNGVVYVQHPLRKNVYFDVDSFHAAMLTEKYEELKRLLQYLGARKISATVIQEDNVATSEKRTRSVKSDNNFAKAEVHGNVNWQGSTAEEIKLYTKLSSEEKFNIGGAPSIPEDLIFYPHESAWQRIAEGALKSIYNECDITLEYRQDYAVNRQKMLDIEAKVQVFIPSFELNISTSFESNLRRITSTIWNYKVEFGNATSAVGFSRCEQTFVKRARRYAANDGRIDTEEREDLVKLAETLGIDAIRMEELIEEAFE